MWAVAERKVLVPVESVAVNTVPLLDRLVVHGVSMTGLGPLVSAEVVEDDEVLEDVFVEVGVDCAGTDEVEVSELNQKNLVSPAIT